MVTKQERIKRLIARKRSLSRRKKAIPEELQKPLHMKPVKKEKAKKKKKPVRRKSAYDALQAYLKEQKELTVTLSFIEIEKIIGRRLPASARKYPAWWANVRDLKRGARHAQAWLSTGFMVKKVDLKKGEVVFRKPRGRRKGTPYPIIILEAAHALMDEKIKAFTRKDLLEKAKELHPRLHLKKTSFNPMIQAMYVGSRMKGLVKEDWQGTLERVSRGMYRLSAKGKQSYKKATMPKKRGRKPKKS